MNEIIRAFWYYTLGKYFSQTPPILILFVTNRCNARCRHCFYWQNLKQKTKKELSLKKIKRLSQNLDHLELLLISGGEPFLRDDLSKIVKVFWQNNGLKTISFVTNCLLPEKIAREVKKIVEISPKLQVVVCLSLDGMQKIHDQIRGVKGAFKKVQETYQNLIKLKRKYRNLRIRFNSTVFNFNYKNLFHLIDQMPKLFPESWTLSLSLIRGKPYDSKLKLPEIEELKRLFTYKLEKFKGKRSWSSRFLEKIIFSAQLKTLQEKKQIASCEAGRLIGVVYEDGSVGHCELSPGFDNLKGKTFRQIWQGRKSKDLRKKIVNKKCFCTHECFLFPSMLAHLPSWLKLTPLF